MNFSRLVRVGLVSACIVVNYSALASQLVFSDLSFDEVMIQIETLRPQIISARHKAFVASKKASIDSNVETLAHLRHQTFIYQNLIMSLGDWLKAASEDNQEEKWKIASMISAYHVISEILKKDSFIIVGKLSEQRKSMDSSQRKAVNDLLGEWSNKNKTFHKYLSDFSDSVQSPLIVNVNEIYLESVSTLYSNQKNGAKEFFTILGNLTWGLPNTVIGGVLAIGAVATSPFRGGYGIRWSRNGQQFQVDTRGMGVYGSSMSMGLFELDYGAGSGVSYHEGGHASQSAVLGPLYIPAALASYGTNLGHGGFIEYWADDWASSGSSSRYRYSRGESIWDKVDDEREDSYEE